MFSSLSNPGSFIMKTGQHSLFPYLQQQAILEESRGARQVPGPLLAAVAVKLLVSVVRLMSRICTEENGMCNWWNGTRKRHDSTRWLPTRPGFEALESRDLLSVFSPIERRPLPGFTGYTPAQILNVYGFDQLKLAQPGQGQTIDFSSGITILLEKYCEN